MLAITAATLLATNTQAAAPIENPEVLAWRLVPAVTGANLRDVHMVSATDGWAVGENGTVLRYDGTSWSPVNINPQPSNETLVDVHMLSATDGYIGGWGESGASGTIYRWNGTSWGLVYNAPRDINRIDAVASNDVWASGVGQIYHYDGTSWTLGYNEDQGRNIFAIQMVSATEGWAVGANQLIAHYLNGSWIPLKPSPAPQTLYDAFFTAPNDGWAVGFTDSTYVMHYDGVNWTRAYSPTAQLSRMYFLSATDGWAISYFNILHYDGTGFTEVNNPYPNGLNSIYMLTATDGWIVGTDGAMLHYSDDATPTPTATATATSIPACGAAWRIVASPNGDAYNILEDVAVVSINDAWAVGSYFDGTLRRVLIQHWDGNTWNVVPTSQPGEGHAFLYDIAAVSADDIWAVGQTDEAPLTMHWDGTAWSRVTSPKASGYDFLYGVWAASANNVWAVGSSETSPGESATLIEYWNGSTWTIVPSPNIPLLSNVLRAASGTSANDVWAVGDAGNDGTSQPLVLHWNGQDWTIVNTPDPSGFDRLYGVSAISTDDVWAVGVGLSDDTGTRVMHWNGNQWSVIPGPSTGSPYAPLQDILSFSANDVWAVGALLNNTTRTFTAHWDGSMWSSVPSPNSGPAAAILNGVAAASPNDLWAVGHSGDIAFSTDTLIEHYSDPCVTPTPVSSNTPTSTAISTPAQASATSTPLAPTATPSQCAVQFVDVPSTNTFYSFVRCLACRGIMGGYSDNTFRPNNDITRGQLSKIVANSAAFNEPVTGQTFEDVQPDNAFYPYVERMAGRGIIGGYPCGGVSEPCGSGKPYFRPNANATRGQISKIVSEAKGYGDPQTGQTFEDVAVGSTFHLWIERLASQGIMGGYPCGGAGEPCGNANKPYFRPNAKATRGQTSKIVANTFFPGCQP
jgi:hypothetical protein